VRTSHEADLLEMVGVPAATIPALLRLGALSKHDWDRALEEVLRIASALLGVDRVSYWTFRDDPPSIHAELGYVSSRLLFERGTVLLESDCGEYVAETRRLQILAIDDTASDARARSLASYLKQHGVGALLDVPVFARGKLAGILCHEHVGGPREWTARETELALSVGQALATALEARARGSAEDAEQRSSFLARVSTALARTLDLDEARELTVRLPIPLLAEMVLLIGYDGARAWSLAQAHQDAGGQALLDRLARQRSDDVSGPGIGMKALREQQSLLLPLTNPSTLHAAGLDEESAGLIRRLGIRSAMSVLLEVRGETTGALTFATTTKSYDNDDLHFAESYAQRVGLMLSNVELYAQAKDAILVRDEFLSLAAHELRTPLMSLTLSADVLAKEACPDAPIASRRAVETIARQTRGLARLSDLLLAASQTERAPIRVDREPVDLAALVREVTTDFETALTRAGCELRLAADAPVLIHGDLTELRVVVSNLLNNAMKFGAGRPVDVAVDAPDGKARVTVRDHGIGIPDEQRARIFRRFERGVSMRHFGGLGLGLHLASRIVEAHGGTLRASSGAGEGATLTIELPPARPAASAPSSSG
jgi:signal transduction histidine kinase